MGEYVKNNFSTRYKTTQLYDLSKRIHNALQNLAQPLLTVFVDFVGNNVDFQTPELNVLSTLQNLHVLTRVLSNLQQSYPAEIISMLFMEAVKFLELCQQFKYGSQRVHRVLSMIPV